MKIMLSFTGIPKRRDVPNSIGEDVAEMRTDSTLNKLAWHVAKRNQNLHHNLNQNLNLNPNPTHNHTIPRNHNPHVNNQIQEENVPNQKILETATNGRLDTFMTRKIKDVEVSIMVDVVATKTTSELNKSVKMNVLILVQCHPPTEVVMTTSPDGISMKEIIGVMNSSLEVAMVTKTISSLRMNVCDSVLRMTTPST